MNILVFVRRYALKNKGGGETYLHRYLHAIKNKFQNANIKVLLPECEKIEKYIYDEIEVFETTENIKQSLKYIDDCDLLITQLCFMRKSTLYALSINKPVINIHHCHEDYRDITSEERVLKIFNANNSYIKAKEKLKYGEEIKNYSFVAPYIDFKKYNSCFKNVENREYITLINPLQHKGYDLILELAKKYKNRKFMIVRGGYYHEQQHITEFKNLSNCHIVDNTDDMIKDVFIKSRIILQPSRWESWGMVSAEAQSAGIPVLLSRDMGLVDNNGPFNLYGDMNEQCTPENINNWCKLIEMLDHKETYCLWSDWLMSFRKNECIKQEKQQEKQINLIEDYINWINNTN